MRSEDVGLINRLGISLIYGPHHLGDAVYILRLIHHHFSRYACVIDLCWVSAIQETGQNHRMVNTSSGSNNAHKDIQRRFDALDLDL